MVKNAKRRVWNVVKKKASVEIMASNMISICWNEPGQKCADYIKSNAIKIC